jgi:tetratricopeptide (TPR) repeat protein
MWRFQFIAPLLMLAVILTGGCNYQESVPVNEPLTADLIDQNNHGVGLMGQFEFERAREIFAHLVQQRPYWSDAKINLAVALMNRAQPNDLSTAGTLLREVLKNDKKSLRAHYCLGLAELQEQAPDTALPQFQFAAAADSRDAYATYFAGKCLLEIGYYQASLTWFEESIRRDPYLPTIGGKPTEPRGAISLHANGAAWGGYSCRFARFQRTV